MQENNFEGQVHDRMEGFKIDPSEKLWGKIQADMISQKKSKFGILPAALFMSCFLLATFFLHDLEKRKPATTASVYQVINEAKPFVKETQINLHKNKVTAVSPKNKISIRGNKNLDNIDLNETKQIRGSEEKRIKTTSKQATVVIQENEHYGVNERVEMLQDKNVKDIKSEDVVTINYNKKDSLQQTIPIKNLIKIDSTAVKEEKQEQKLYTTTTVNTQKNNKWQFFATASGGKFYTGNSYLSQIANVSYYNLSADMQNGSGASAGFYQPSTVKSGFSYGIAISANRKLSRKTDISVGLGYQYGGTFIKTGKMLDSALRNSFTIGSVNEFHNKYHFIQLPVEIQSMIGNGKKLPLYWNAGFTFSRLISADALQFNRTQGRYFKDNSYFNKNAIGVSAGLSLAILKTQQTQWLIGPQFYYSLTPVAGKGLYDKTHYSFLGLQVQKKL